MTTSTFSQQLETACNLNFDFLENEIDKDILIECDSIAIEFDAMLEVVNHIEEACNIVPASISSDSNLRVEVAKIYDIKTDEEIEITEDMYLILESKLREVNL